MKKSLMMIGLATMMCGTSGCFTMMSHYAGHGWGDDHMEVGCVTYALTMDVITLPLQAAAVVLVGGGWLIWTGGEWVVEGTEKLFD